MIVSPEKKGSITEGIILAELLKRGLTVSAPFGYSQRYDLIVDVSSKLYRLQCKTGRLRNGAVEFNTCSINNVTHKRKDYRGQIEFFAVLHPESHQVYLVEPHKVGKANGFLRFEIKIPTNRCQIVLAEDFEIDKVLERLSK